VSRAESKTKRKQNAPALIAGAFAKAVIGGTLYPQGLLSAVINRIRAEQAARDKNDRPTPNVNYLRAALIKAILVRKARILNHNLEVPVALDKNNKNEAYLLGRLFAALEKAQRDANPGINATIKDRFYGSASTAPRAVFPQLLRLAQHHIAKAEYGYANDQRIEEILNDLQQFPAHLPLDQQGMFAIGYYQQRQDFFKGKQKETETTASTEEK
jgi:CRISPR-associated protein Csd1